MRALLLVASVSLLGCSPSPVKAPKESPPADPALFAGGTLPLADHEGKGIPGDAPVLTVEAGSLRLNEIVVDDAQNVRQAVRSIPLTNALRDTRTAWIEHHPGDAFPGVVVYRLDRTTSSRLVSRLLFAAAFAGYPYGCLVAMTANGRPLCIEIGFDMPEPPQGMAKPLKTRMASIGPDRFRLESGEVVSRNALRATLAARDLTGHELVIQAGEDFDLQSLVAT
ncbi:MAG: hypothetical protein ACXVEF_42420, partial [Polyangiales bacterium]